MTFQRIIPYAIWFLPAGWTVAIFLLLTRKVDDYVPGWMPAWADKPAHMLLFGALAVFTYLAFRTGSPITMQRAAISAFCYATIYGAAMEYYQHYIPWRTADWGDVVANTFGAAVVFLLLWAERAIPWFCLDA